ncbi:hypothetical protein CVT26_005460, partial [Gymnopilus dilepis]
PPSPALPLDILATIIESLSPSLPADLHSLRSLALSSRLLTPLCQRVIFKRIDLRNRYRRRYKPGIGSGGGVSLIKAFAELVSSESSRHIGAYVLHLSYQAHDADIADGTLAQLSTILSSLPSLRSLHFSWIVPGNRTFDFNTLITDPDSSTKLFRDALESQLRSAHLLQLTVPNMRNFPFSSFVDKAAVVDLVEEAPFSVQISIVSPKPTPCLQPSIHLRQYALGSISWPRRILDVSIAGQTCLRPPSVGIPALDVSSTKSALICVKEQINVVEAEKVLRCAKGGIEELSYEVAEASWFRGLSHALLSTGSPGSTSTLTSNSASSSPSLQLTTLELSHTSDSDPDPLVHITDELALLSSPSASSSSSSSSIATPGDASHSGSTLPHLHTLSLALVLSMTHAPLPPSSLSRLDELLSDRRRFPSLRTLSVEITVIKRGRWDENEDSRAPTGDENGGEAASPSPASPPPPPSESESGGDDPEVVTEATNTGEGASADANANASETPADTLPVGALDFQEAEQRHEELSQTHHQLRVLRVLDELKARHLASLPRLVSMSIA